MYIRFTYRFMTGTEQQNIVTKPTRKTAVMQSIRASAPALCFRAMLLLFVPYLLAGCAKTGGSENLTTLAQSILPEQSVTDYRVRDCDLIWDIAKPAAMENGLYWLRFIDCTDRLTSAKAREMAKRFIPEAPTDWHQVLKQSILLGRATSVLVERINIVENFNRHSAQFPVTLRPLLQLWREQQYLKINLVEESVKFQRLQSDSDNKIDSLKEIRARLEYELRSMSRKLENLTDIERQLSSRKQEQSSAVTPSNTDTSSDNALSNNTLSNNTAESKNTPAANADTQTEAHASEEKGAE
ncbi:two-component system QseEF-associated lipoprotein QseG [Xenorhabdus sp. IM139775]|uniref:two-component system QseEF-associated lipoprotein QseG n=1 Tax=Xenorhabdus sp. IM139775 TaxID=3025876 RepID=UPI002359F725|nr:two-component system QseEF-associated lipoprotein QseG [Xenorhabdus sp. IM139775]MDC9592743.1 two-component system QseEF-associated lipoprotein QseG [Xenorhabdus sp. IM139775]